MKKMIQNRGQQGFTLVEVIVVAVIVLVLAAVAIPMYNGYIKDARRSSAENLAETTAAAANTLWRRTGNNPFPNSGHNLAPNDAILKVHFDSTKHTVVLNFTGNSGDVIVTDKKDNTVTVTKPYR